MNMMAMSFNFLEIQIFIYTRNWQIFTTKDHTVNILGFEGYLVSAIATQFCCYRSKAATDKYIQVNERDFVPIKFNLHQQAAGCIRPWAMV